MNRSGLTIEYIQQQVSEAYGLDVRLLISPRRARKITRPRQVAVWLCFNLLPGRSLPEIGRAFGNRDHTTIMHAIRRVDTLSDHDPAFFETLVIIRDRIIEATASQPARQVSIVAQARELARTFAKAAFALAEADPELAARTFRRLSASFQPVQQYGGKR